MLSLTIQLDAIKTLEVLRLPELEVISSMDAVRLSTSQTWSQKNYSRLFQTACCQHLIETHSLVGELTSTFLPQEISQLDLSRPGKIDAINKS